MEGQPTPLTLAEHAGEEILGASEARLGEPDVVGTLGGDLHLRGAARVIAHDPAHLALQYRSPQVLHVLAGPDGWVDLGERARGGVRVEEEMPDGDLAAKVDVRKHAPHGHSGFHGLA